MTLNAKRRRAHSKLAALPGVRSVRRPVTPGAEQRFDLHYIRTGPASERPLVVIPGGPGVASIAQYRTLRKHLAADGVGVLMVEHRGIGMSRHDDAGRDLPPDALTVEQVVDDIGAVLDAENVAQADVYGTSYGTYIASGVGVRHPGRVHAMVLDSPVLSAGDIQASRDAIRSLLLYGTSPETRRLAPKARRLLDAGLLASADVEVLSTVYGYGGADLLERQLDLLLGGHELLWHGMARITALMLRKFPYRNEIDLVGRIAFRELDYAGKPDGLPLDPSAAMLQMRDQLNGAAPDFEAEPFDLAAEMPRFAWPTVVLSGGRDLTTPFALAQRAAELIPEAVLVQLPTAPHGLLDFRDRAARDVISTVRTGDYRELGLRAAELDAMPSRLPLRLLAPALTAAAIVERALPAHSPKPATS
jgi:pimeloyl-ACP methyl ester carboxylesterase